MAKSLELFFQSSNKCFGREFFFFLVKSYSISAVCLQHTMKIAWFLAFFKVSIDHPFDNRESRKRNYCFEKNLEKVLNFGFKNLYEP